VEFSFARPGYDDAGYTTQLPYPLPRGSAFITANAGSGLDPFGDRDVSGVTTRGVARVVITLRGGSTVETRPRLARRAAYRRYAWVRGLRSYDVFMPASAVARQASGLDRHGRVVERVSL
jgi:hypothetical protein